MTITETAMRPTLGDPTTILYGGHSESGDPDHHPG